MLLKLSEFLNFMAFILKQKSLYYELKHFINKKQSYFKLIHHHERYIGKTYTLLKLAKEYNCPIAINSREQEVIYKQKYAELFNEDLEIIPCDNLCRGKQYNLILCEEGISKLFIDNVLKPMCNTIVGYINTI